MQHTTNYNMTMAEGSDIVNPLTQIFPNFNIIDGAMKNNKDASIGTATEVKTGTVHAITRSNTDNPVFRFTASGAWDAGDTMTIDGNSVTVHTSDGKTPVKDAYVIGCDVIAILNGASVTLLVSESSTQETEQIICDGVQTYADNLEALLLAMDPTKLTPRSVLTFDANVIPIVEISPGIQRYRFVSALFSPNTGRTQNWQVLLQSGSCGLYQLNGEGNVQNYSASIPSVGQTFTLYY